MFNMQASFQVAKKSLYYQVNSSQVRRFNPLKQKDIHEITSAKVTANPLVDQLTISKIVVIEVPFTE
jgi:hypothetical protein